VALRHEEGARSPERSTRREPRQRMQQLWLPGSACHVRGLDLEPLLRGELIEAMAAILLRPWDAWKEPLEQSEKSAGVAE
jgi:hypothetical protein